MQNSLLSIKIKRVHRLAKEGGWIVGGQVASFAGALVLIRVLTEHLDPTQYGQLALGLTVVGLINQVVMGGISVGAGRFYSIAFEEHDLNAYLQSVRRLLLCGTVAVMIIGFFLITGLLMLGYSHWVGLAVASISFALLFGYKGTLNGIQNAARQRSIVAIHNGFDAWLKILFALSVMLWLDNSSTAVVIGYSCSALLVVLSQLIFLRRTIPRYTPKTVYHQIWTNRIWRYSWPFSAFGIFTWMQQASDRWALQAFTTTHEVGLYAVVFQLGYTPITIVLNTAMTFLGPILYQRAGDATDCVRKENVHQISWRITSIALSVTGLGFLVALMMHDEIFRVLVATEYHTISYLLPWVVLAGGLFGVGQIISLKLMSEMKSMTLLVPKIVTALLGIGFNIAGAAIIGLQGVVAAMVAFSSIYLIWMVFLGRAQPTNRRHLAWSEK